MASASQILQRILSDVRLLEGMLKSEREAGYREGVAAYKKALMTVEVGAGATAKAAKPARAVTRGKASKAGEKRTTAPRGQNEASMLDYLRGRPDGARITVGALHEAGHPIPKTSIGKTRERLLKEGRIEKVGENYRITPAA